MTLRRFWKKTKQNLEMGVGKVAQPVGCSLGRDEDLNLDSQNPSETS